MTRLSVLTVFLFALPAVAQNAKKADKVDFEKQILPILEKRCVECHSTPAPAKEGERQKKPKGGVVFDSKEGLMKSKRGKVVVPKKSGDSLLYTLTTLEADDEDIMPPKKKGEPLTKEQTDLIKAWIDQGGDFGKWVGKKAEASTGKDGGDKEGGDKEGGKEGGGHEGHDKPAPAGKKKAGGGEPLVELARNLKPQTAEALSAFDKGPFGSAR